MDPKGVNTVGTMLNLLRQLRRNRSGNATFMVALGAPALIGAAGFAIDTARFVTVVYQKGNDLSPDEIHAVLLSQAVGAPYLLDTDRLLIEVAPTGTSRVPGTTEFAVDVSYTLEDWLPFIELEETALTYTRPIFVVAPGA